MNAVLSSATAPADSAPEFSLRRRLSFRRMPASIKACAMLAVLLALVTVFAPWLTPHDPDATQILAKLKPPAFMAGGESTHVFGTDQVGRDLLSRCLYGVRVSVGIALLGLIIGCLIGTTLGVISGLFGGMVDRVIMMLVDVFISVPNLLIVLVGVAAFGTDILVLVFLIGLARWETYARVVRG